MNSLEMMLCYTLEKDAKETSPCLFNIFANFQMLV